MSTSSEPGEVTRLLQEASRGNREAFGALVSLVYRELSDLAHRRLRHEPPGHTLGTTGLVHEAYLRLAEQSRAQWENRGQFFAVASEVMRRVLVDHARRRQRAKRGGRVEHVALADALDEALTALAAFNPEGARIVQLRFFGGLSNEEIAAMVSSSERTVRRQWAAAKAWLRRELAPQLSHGSALGELGIGE
jgi:RNA polymerase sigma-70 factor, ECF subfamily